MTDEELNVIRVLFRRYEKLIHSNDKSMISTTNKCDPDHLLDLCNEAIINTTKYPFDKLCRWLGFVQGVLAVQGIIDVDTERDYTRPLFHSLSDRHIPTF